MNNQSGTSVIKKKADYRAHSVVCVNCGKLLKLDKQYFADGENSKSGHLCFECFKANLNAKLPPLSKNKVITNKM